MTRLKAIWMLRVSICFNTVAVVQSTMILLQCLLQGWCEGIIVISASDENWKELLSSTISPEASFNGDGNEETLNVNKTSWQ